MDFFKQYGWVVIAIVAFFLIVIIAISYKNIASPNKSIKWVQGSDHGFVPAGSEVIVWSTMKKADKKK